MSLAPHIGLWCWCKTRLPCGAPHWRCWGFSRRTIGGAVHSHTNTDWKPFSPCMSFMVYVIPPSPPPPSIPKGAQELWLLGASMTHFHFQEGLEFGAEKNKTWGPDSKGEFFVTTDWDLILILIPPSVVKSVIIAYCWVHRNNSVVIMFSGARVTFTYLSRFAHFNQIPFFQVRWNLKGCFSILRFGH